MNRSNKRIGNVSHKENGGNKGSVLVAMSGGVDSSIAAKFLLDEGYDVIGLTMELLGDEESKKAKEVCGKLGIDHVSINLRDKFERFVVKPFCEAYVDGLTPNPCVLCNKYLKFGELHRLREEMGCDYLATGHYAKRCYNEKSGAWQLCRATDNAKDQTYFLYNITQEQLAHTLFPLEDITKQEVKATASVCDLPSADSEESQDICFIKDESHVDFIKRMSATLGVDMKSSMQEGNIVDASGSCLGTHSGLINYTLGQRKGIGVAASEPLYVMNKDMKNNELVVGFADEALIEGFVVKDFNLISGDGITSLSKDALYTIKSHYRQKPVEASVIPETESVAVMLSQPCKATSPGQSLVIYEGETVVGGGVIEAVLPCSSAC